MFNPVIIVALIVQTIVARISRIAGAIIGFLVTTGILVWGLSVYGQGGQITFFGAPLSQPVFLIACLVWYGFDTSALLAARKEASQEKAGAIEQRAEQAAQEQQAIEQRAEQAAQENQTPEQPSQ